MGYLIEKVVVDLVRAKVTLTNAELLAGGIVKSIPEYPAKKGYYWAVNYMIGFLNNQTTPFVGGGNIHIQADAAIDYMYKFTTLWTAATTDQQTYAQPTTAWGNVFLNNAELQIHKPLASTLGDGFMDIYIGAYLIAV